MGLVVCVTLAAIVFYRSGSLIGLNSHEAPLSIPQNRIKFHIEYFRVLAGGKNVKIQ